MKKENHFSYLGFPFLFSSTPALQTSPPPAPSPPASGQPPSATVALCRQPRGRCPSALAELPYRPSPALALHTATAGPLPCLGRHASPNYKSRTDEPHTPHEAPTPPFPLPLPCRALSTCLCRATTHRRFSSMPTATSAPYGQPLPPHGPARPPARAPVPSSPSIPCSLAHSHRRLCLAPSPAASLIQAAACHTSAQPLSVARCDADPQHAFLLPPRPP